MTSTYICNGVNGGYVWHTVSEEGVCDETEFKGDEAKLDVRGGGGLVKAQGWGVS